MKRKTGAMHVATIMKRQTNKAGHEHVYKTHLLRRCYREGTKVKHETLANLSALPQPALDALKASLSGHTLMLADEGLEVTRSLPHGHVAAVAMQAKTLGLPQLLGPASRMRDIAMALTPYRWSD